MRKTKFWLIAALAVLFAVMLSFGASAEEDPTIIISEDYKTIEYLGDTYTYVSYYADDVTFMNYNAVGYVDFECSEQQKADITDVYVYEYDNALKLSIYFAQGGKISAYYVLDEHFDEYNLLLQGKSDIYKINGEKYTALDLYTESMVISSLDYILYDAALVNIYVSTESIYRTLGEIVVDLDGNCYYLDYSENGTKYNDFEALDFDELVVHKVTNPDIIENLTVDEEEPDSNNPIKIILTSIILAMIFLVAPLAVAVLCTVMLRKATSTYKKLFKILAISCYTTALCFVILAVAVLLII